MGSEASRPADEAAVRGLYAQLMAGWNKGSAREFAAAFAEDGHLVAFDGAHFRHREEIISFHQPLFAKWQEATRLVGNVESMRVLSPEFALMHARGGTVMRGKSRPAPERDSIRTLVAVRHGDEWRLAAFQNTRVRPLSRNARSILLLQFTDWLWRAFGARH